MREYSVSVGHSLSVREEESQRASAKSNDLTSSV